MKSNAWQRLPYKWNLAKPVIGLSEIVRPSQEELLRGPDDVVQLPIFEAPSDLPTAKRGNVDTENGCSRSSVQLPLACSSVASGGAGESIRFPVTFSGG